MTAFLKWVNAKDTLDPLAREMGFRSVMINSNPETVSTDFDASTRLYFEPLDPESVRSVIDAESPDQADLLPAVVAYGGQTPLNLAAPLAAGGVPLLGSDLEAIDQAEERTRFSALLDRLGIPQPEGGMAHSVDEALTLAERIGYPVIVRPSFVIGGLAIDFAYSPEDLVRHLAAAAVVDPDRPVRIDRFLDATVDVTAGAGSNDDIALLSPSLLDDPDHLEPGPAVERCSGASACHAEARTPADTDWSRIAGLYDGLDNDAETRDLVTAHVAADLCNRLAEQGVDQFHFYTMNRAGLSLSTCRLLGLKPQVSA